jgi:hypothetical protein
MSKKILIIQTGNQKCADKLQELLDKHFDYTVINTYNKALGKDVGEASLREVLT